MQSKTTLTSIKERVCVGVTDDAFSPFERESNQDQPSQKNLDTPERTIEILSPKLGF